jgi:hypothetical protein
VGIAKSTFLIGNAHATKQATSFLLPSQLRSPNNPSKVASPHDTRPGVQSAEETPPYLASTILMVALLLLIWEGSFLMGAKLTGAGIAGTFLK